MTTGERIKMRRKQLGLSADQLAERVGVNRATIYRYESEEIKNMGTETLKPLAVVLRTTPAWLLNGGDQEEESISDARQRLFDEDPDARALFDMYCNASAEEKYRVVNVVKATLGIKGDE